MISTHSEKKSAIFSSNTMILTKFFTGFGSKNSSPDLLSNFPTNKNVVLFFLNSPKNGVQGDKIAKKNMGTFFGPRWTVSIS